jgi:hypothetical protein
MLVRSHKGVRVEQGNRDMVIALVFFTGAHRM